MNSLVSMIIPNSNKGRWLADCLWSVFSQSYRSLEVIVCDNGSTDRSREILSTFEGLPGFMCLLHPEALGVARGWNMALAKATGIYITTMGSDDLLKPDHIEMLMKAAAANPEADMIFGDIEEIDVSGNVIGYGSAANGLATIFERCSIGHGSSVVRKAVYDELGGYDEQLESSTDWEIIIRILMAGKKAVYAGRAGYQWRRVPGSMTDRYGIGSATRKASHSYIRRKHGLPGQCRCGCGAT